MSEERMQGGWLDSAEPFDQQGTRDRIVEAARQLPAAWWSPYGEPAPRNVQVEPRRGIVLDARGQPLRRAVGFQPQGNNPERRPGHHPV